jgi:hypothetical protein
MSISLKTLKPRNLLVARALFRNAGAHRSGAGARRQRARQEMRRELDHLRSSP